MKELGITGGCTSTTFCPETAANNAHIAVFISRARVLVDNQCTSPTQPNCAVDSFPYTTAQRFVDAPSTEYFFQWIQRLGDLGAVSPSVITYGCLQDYFCPPLEIVRGEMANQVFSALITAQYWQSYFKYTK